MSLNNLILEKREPGIQIIKFNRPKALNALNSETLKELQTVLREIKGDSSIRVVIFTGEGDKSFIAGADITEMKNKTRAEGIEFARAGHEVGILMETLPQPTIAAVNGFALGGGTEMAIACDFILASETALFGQPEVSLGITPGFGATFRLAQFVGLPRARDLIFSGRKVKATEAKEMGLVNAVYPADGFLDSVMKVAIKIASHSQSAVAASKQMINELAHQGEGLQKKVDTECAGFGGLFGSPDQQEGMNAFIEKRKPKFEGLS